MGRVLFVFAVVIAVLCCSRAVWGKDVTHVTPVQQCSGQNFENLQKAVEVSPCGKNKCKLIKGTDVTFRIRFKPTENVKNLITEVSGIIGGVPLPFIGVTGTSACDHIVKAESGEAASCPLQAGEEYLYSNSFHIEPFYPVTNVLVHWALNDGAKDIICFEVPAAIRDKKN